MARVILGSLAGFLTAAVVVVLITFAAATALGVEQGQTSAVYLTINLVGSFAAAAGGGYLAQQISRREKIIAPAVMATLMFLLTIGSVAGEPAPGQPEWYPFALLVLGPGGALAGGMLAARSRLRAASTGN